jgi:hypothetical protein
MDWGLWEHASKKSLLSCSWAKNVRHLNFQVMLHCIWFKHHCRPLFKFPSISYWSMEYRKISDFKDRSLNRVHCASHVFLPVLWTLTTSYVSDAFTSPHREWHCTLAARISVQWIWVLPAPASPSCHAWQWPSDVQAPQQNLSMSFLVSFVLLSDKCTCPWDFITSWPLICLVSPSWELLRCDSLSGGPGLHPDGLWVQIL